MYRKVSTCRTGGGGDLSDGFLRAYSSTAWCLLISLRAEDTWRSPAAALKISFRASVQWIMFSWNVPPMTMMLFSGAQIGKMQPLFKCIACFPRSSLLWETLFQSQSMDSHFMPGWLCPF